MLNGRDKASRSFPPEATLSPCTSERPMSASASGKRADGAAAAYWHAEPAPALRGWPLWLRQGAVQVTVTPPSTATQAHPIPMSGMLSQVGWSAPGTSTQA